MWSTVRSAIDLGLEGQASRLMAMAQNYKDRAIEEARVQAVSAGVTAALVLFGLLFVAVAVGIGLIALYYAVAMVRGPFAGFAAAGGAAMVIAALIFTIVAMRANKPAKSAANFSSVKSQATGVTRKTAASSGPRGQVDTLALGKQTVEAATGIVRDGSREAVLATLAATVIVGMLIGRRR